MVLCWCLLFVVVDVLVFWCLWFDFVVAIGLGLVGFPRLGVGDVLGLGCLGLVVRLCWWLFVVGCVVELTYVCFLCCGFRIVYLGLVLVVAVCLFSCLVFVLCLIVVVATCLRVVVFIVLLIYF